MPKKDPFVSFPQGDIFISKNGKARIVKNKNYESKFNSNIYKLQNYLDNRVVMELQKYVSKDTGAQEKSIRLATDCGSGIVTIGVPYAKYQAYSKRIKKRVGLRGTQPFERMVADKGDSILRSLATYSRRINK